MATLFTEAFDSLTPPALPAGWVASGAPVTATDQFHSSPNSLLCSGNGSRSLLRSASPSTADHMVAAWLRLSAVSQAVNIGAREQSATTPFTTCYYLAVTSAALTLNRRGTTATLATRTATIPTGAWLRATLRCEGTTISAKLQRESDGFFLQADGTWAAGEVYALSVTDSTHTGAGHVFIGASTTVGQSAWLDDLRVDDLTPDVGTFVAAPIIIPSSHPGNITLALTGNGTSWGGGTTFTVSGVTGAAKVSQSVANATHATLVVSTGAGVGALSISDGGTTFPVTVAVPALSVSPGTQESSTAPVTTLSASNALWTQETPATLFTLSGLAGASLGVPTIVGDGLATATLTLGAATGTLTITDNSTGKTTTVTVAALADKLLLCDGNSMTFTGPTSAWPTKIADYIGPSWLIRNIAVSGQTTQQMAADAASEADSQFSALRSRCILVAWEGRNDMVVNGITGAQAFANMKAYCQARRAAGWKVVVLTMLPTTAVDETHRGDYNTPIRATWRTFADGLADVAADPRIGDAGDALDTTYFYDGTHMTDAGYAIIAQTVAGALGGVQTGGRWPDGRTLAERRTLRV